MLDLTPNERLALGVTALLIAAGAGVRLAGGREAAGVDWTAAAADTQDVGGVSRLRAAVEAGAEERRRASEPLRPGERIDPNRADAVELDRLPRVGPALAARIIAHREAEGPFRTLGDLQRVPGVGPALLESIAPLVTLPRGPATGGGGATARIDVNQASASELQALPGIGPALAQRIVEWRAANGPFRSAEALEAVPGIGPALRERIAPHLRFRP